jgi:hypothetical protein
MGNCPISVGNKEYSLSFSIGGQVAWKRHPSLKVAKRGFMRSFPQRTAKIAFDRRCGQNVIYDYFS